jgi:hypothetical protein
MITLILFYFILLYHILTFIDSMVVQHAQVNLFQGKA